MSLCCITGSNREAVQAAPAAAASTISNRSKARSVKPYPDSPKLQ